MYQNFIFKLAAAFAFGFGFAYFILQKNYSQNCRCNCQPYHHVAESQTDPDSHQTFKIASGQISAQSNHSIDDMTQVREDFRGQRLAEQVRVLCWVMTITTPANNKTKAVHVKNTWGKRCDKPIFMSSQSDENLGAVGLPNVAEGREWLWAKATGAFKYVWEHHRDEANWLMTV